MIEKDLVLQGRYEVETAIGSGSFGQTWRVRDRHSQTAKVLKVLDPQQTFTSEVDRAKVIALFEREAQALRTLDHPGIPKADPEGCFLHHDPERFEPYHCFVMAEVPGQNLRRWQQTHGAIDEPQAQQWLAQLLDILIYLHGQNPALLHRDIKPSNIMLQPNGQLVLIDFGGVREVTETYLQKQAAEQSMTKLFASGYSATEQIQGATTTRSDLFSLGRTLISLLVGEPISELDFDAETNELRWRQRVKVSELFGDLLAALTAAQPKARPASAAVAQRRLAQQSRWRNGVLLGWRKFRPFRRVSAVVMVGAIAWPFAAPWISDQLNEQGYQAFIADNWSRAEHLFRWALRFDPQQAESHYYLGYFDEERDEIEQAMTRYQRAIDAQETFSRAYNNLGRLHLLNDNSDVAVKILEQGISIMEDDPQINDSNRSTLHKNLGWALKQRERLNESEQHLDRALNWESDRPAAHCLLAQVYEAQDQMEEARTSWQTCYEYSAEQDQDLPEIQEWREDAESFLASGWTGQTTNP
ncbi:MAG: protein kinase [Cyanobacteria bacterium P01_G01_bin.54]